MDEIGNLDAMSVPDPDFPSGTWGGHYEQDGRRHPQEMRLDFVGGRVCGAGEDGIGSFTILGVFDSSAMTASWTKQYRTHPVRYVGQRVPDGLRGTWNIGWFTGSFHLRPGASGVAAQASTSAQVSVRQPAKIGR
jgi:hypothetical protein